MKKMLFGIVSFLKNTHNQILLCFHCFAWLKCYFGWIFCKYSFAMFYSSEGAKCSLNEVVFNDTPESDYFAPSPPQLHVRGKTEIFIEWDPPKNLLGRLNYYELRMDNMVIYRGIDRCFTAQALQPTKVYSFTVSAWMSDGRCESLPRTRRISKQSTPSSILKRRISLKE
nr:usherin-like isoform X2 [Hydra vulgaris]